MDILPPTPPARQGQTRNTSSPDKAESFGALVDDNSQSEMPQATAPAPTSDASSSAAAPGTVTAPAIAPVASTGNPVLDLIPLAATEGEATDPLTEETAADPLAAFLDAVEVATNPEEVTDETETTEEQASDTTDGKKTDTPAPAAVAAAVAPATTAVSPASGEAEAVDAVLAETAPAQVPTPIDGDGPAAETQTAPAAPDVDPALSSGDVLTDGAAPQTAKPPADEPPAHGLRDNTEGLESPEPKTNSSGQPANPVAVLARTLGAARSAEAQANKTDAAAVETQPAAETGPDAAPHADVHGAKPQPKADAPAVETPAVSETAPAPAAERPALPAVDPSAARTPAFHVLMQQQDIRHVPGAAPAETDAMVRAIPVSGIALEIAGQYRDNNTRFDIRLDPPDLGRIDVRLDVDRSGQVTSRLVVEKSETLDLLRRDAPQLERALQDAGLKTGDNGLQFSLRDQSANGRDDEGAQGNAAKLVVTDEEIAPLQSQTNAYGRMLASGGLDIRV